MFLTINFKPALNLIKCNLSNYINFINLTSYVIHYKSNIELYFIILFLF